MGFLNVNAFLDQLNAPKLTKDEQAIVDFYKASGDFSMAMINYRANHDLNQKELAQILGITQSNISRYESGIHNFTIKTMLDLASKMNFQVNICIDDHMGQDSCAKTPVVGGEYSQTLDCCLTDMLSAA